VVQKYSESIGKPYDLIILDLDMPIMNGYEACQKIRRVGVHESIKELLRIETKKKIGGVVQKRKVTDNDIIEDRNKEKIYIVALSGLITDNVIEKGSKCGFDDFSNFSFLIIF
jgi:CheY-like chemotaxis protein